MGLDFALRALRYVMPLIAALIAFFALVRRGTGDSRKALRLSILLVVAALAGTWSIQFLDDLRQERTAEAQLKRNNELLEQVIRGQYPLQNIRASYQFHVPTDLSGIQKYEEFL